MRTRRLLPLLILLCGQAGAEPALPGDRLANEVIARVNEARRQAGCPPLAIHPLLTRAASHQSEDMARRHHLGHVDGLGRDLPARLDAVGYDYGRAAENAAAGDMAAAEVVRGWLESPPHRANMLDCRLRETGVGISHADDELGLYWAQIFGSPRRP